MSHPISELLDISLNKINEMIETNTIIGTPFYYNEQTIIPVSQIKIGFLSGGSDISSNTKNDFPLFGGATGGAINLMPVGFLVVSKDEVTFLSVENKTHLYEEILNYFKKFVDKTTTLVKNNTKE